MNNTLQDYTDIEAPKVNNSEVLRVRGHGVVGWMGKAKNRDGTVFVQYRPKTVKELFTRDGEPTISFTQRILDAMNTNRVSRVVSLLKDGDVLEYELAQFKNAWVGGSHPETDELIYNLEVSDAVHNWDYEELTLSQPIREMQE